MNCRPNLTGRKQGEWRCMDCGFTDVDEHGHYPDRIFRNCPAANPITQSGCMSGCQLTIILQSLGFEYTPACRCKSLSHTMDMMGAAWCRENLNTIVNIMQDEAAKRKVEFSKRGAEWIVLLAIRLAESQRKPNLLERIALKAMQRVQLARAN